MRAYGTRAALVASGAILVLALSACGGSTASSEGTAGTAAAGSGKTGTVSTQKLGGAGDVLVDSNGDALYFNDQESNSGRVLCIHGCTSIWPPLTLPAGMTAPSAAAALAGKLGVVQRPNGDRQVTWAGKPLYTFAEDGGPGKVTGNGASDSFGGTSFSWHVAAAGKAAGTAGSQTSTQQKGGYGY